MHSQTWLPTSRHSYSNKKRIQTIMGATITGVAFGLLFLTNPSPDSNVPLIIFLKPGPTSCSSDISTALQRDRFVSALTFRKLMADETARLLVKTYWPYVSINWLFPVRDDFGCLTDVARVVALLTLHPHFSYSPRYVISSAAFDSEMW